MIWKKKDIRQERIRELSSRYDIDLLLASILVRRGVEAPEEIRFYLESDARFLHNPFHFEEMEDAVDRILAAAEEGESVYVFGDRDVDGITSTVLLREALQAVGIETGWGLPAGDNPYGLTQNVIDGCLEKGVTLLITVDCGISNREEIAYARDKGIDTIVVDHHNLHSDPPEAVAIINPKMEDSAYPFRDLSGCGVASKLFWALLFARTPFYGRPVCLLNVVPGNETFILEAVKLVNLIETDRIREVIAPGIVGYSATRLESFFQDQQIFVYEAATQDRMLRNVFGEDVLFETTDLAPEIGQFLPAARGKSLLRLREQSRIAKYKAGQAAEIDVFANLFISYVMMREKEAFEPFARALDLVALGTLADLMPLRDENRILVARGMDVIQTGVRKGLRELLAAQRLTGKKLSTIDVAWQISPVINSTGRMGVPEKAMELFSAEDEAAREVLAAEVIGINDERKKLGDSMWKQVLPAAKESLEKLGGKICMVADACIHRGITGILAARLVSAFNAPAVVVAFLGDKAVGSIRSTRGFRTSVILERCAPLFNDCGGHDYAAGFSMDASRLPELRRELDAIAPTILLKDIEETIDIDAELPLSYLSPDLIKVVEIFEPYGESNPPLVFQCNGLGVDSVDLVGRNGKSHLKLLLSTGQYRWPALFWNMGADLGKEYRVGDKVDALFTLSRNYFQNAEQLQLVLKDLRRAK